MNQKLLDLEFRWMCNRFPEIIRWVNSEVQGKYCYTLAMWEKDSEGYDLKFLGPRPLAPEVDKDVFWELVKYGQKICDAVFDLESFKDENQYLLRYRNIEISDSNSGTSK